MESCWQHIPDTVTFSILHRVCVVMPDAPLSCQGCLSKFLQSAVGCIWNIDEVRVRRCTVDLQVVLIYRFCFVVNGEEIMHLGEYYCITEGSSFNCLLCHTPYLWAESLFRSIHPRTMCGNRQDIKYYYTLWLSRAWRYYAVCYQVTGEDWERGMRGAEK